MKHLAILVALLFATPALASPVIGQAAPDFTATASDGKAVKLSDYKGKTVVLEWTNDGCPFVKKHYGSGNMQKLQKEAAAEGIVWLSVISSAPGEQGHVDGAGADKLTKERAAAPAAVLLDPSGALGKLYAAKTTPHMFVIGKDGVLAYAGAIDDKPSTDADDISKAINYVQQALAELKAGKPVSVSSTASYGCGVKYAD